MLSQAIKINNNKTINGHYQTYLATPIVLVITQRPCLGAMSSTNDLNLTSTYHTRILWTQAYVNLTKIYTSLENYREYLHKPYIARI